MHLDGYTVACRLVGRMKRMVDMESADNELRKDLTEGPI